jgi:putative ubiquitin-RnfH superfamily antitoxin RatB of RatAB toxin-antitoxin module
MGLNKINVEVVYALPNEQKVISLDVMAGTTLYEAVLQSGILESFPQIDVENDHMGIFGKAVKKPKEQVLEEGDRVEIYRPLLIDPKQARLNRAAKK